MFDLFDTFETIFLDFEERRDNVYKAFDKVFSLREKMIK